jgi:chromate transporter
LNFKSVSLNGHSGGLKMGTKPTFKEAFIFWLKLGFISFGGPAGQIAIMHQYLVEKKKWISESRFLHAMNYCMLLPGPEAQQLATYSGWLLHGARGGLVAGIFFILPSVFILLALSIAYVIFGQVPWFHALFEGLKPAVVAIIIYALVKIGKKSLRSAWNLGVALLSFASIFFLNIPFPLIILGTLVLGLILNRLFPSIFKTDISENMSDRKEETGYYINSLHTDETPHFKPVRFVRQTVLALICWVAPFGLFRIFSSDTAFWNSLSFFFTKAALVTFGGAYAVLPYVAQVSVEKFHWLSASQMMDGLALGETTPGPLIMVLAFVGFMGGYGHYAGSIITGTIGLLITVYFTFLPCFYFVIAGAPLAEQTRKEEKFRFILPFLGAAVTGVMGNLAVYLGKAVFLPAGDEGEAVGIFNIIWTLISLFLLFRYKVNIMLLIGVSALAGLIRFFLFQ